MIKNAERLYIVTVEKVTSRSMNTWYKNTKGKTLFVSVSFTFYVANAGDAAGVRGLITPSATDVPVGIEAPTVARLDMQCSLFVPPGYSYKMARQVTGSATIGINAWIEAY